MTIESIRLRFADPESATTYPAEITAEAWWRRGQDGGTVETEVALGNLAAGTIVAPSLALLGAWPYGFRFELIGGDGRRWPLPPVPSGAAAHPPPGGGPEVRGAIDCWHLTKALDGARLLVAATVATVPERYLLVVSVRPVRLRSLPDAPSGGHHARVPPHFSQMLENPRIASRICSPVSLAMALGAGATGPELHEVIPLCRDPATGMYGLWPLAVRAASRFGRLAAVELLEDWHLVTASLERGLPVVASIRYGAGQLPGAPQSMSGGHLVVVHGVDSDGVRVNDPAAPDRGTVQRTYGCAEFAEAWFRNRGAAYILLP